MTERNNRKVTYLSDEEAAHLSRWADEVGKSESHLLREAVLEYLDRDRTDRIEDKLAGLESQIQEIHAHISEETTHTHTVDPPMKSSSEATEKAREIIRRLQSNHDEVVKDEAVQRAIEDIAGIDDRTIRKYKRLFRKRGLLFEHPGEPPLWSLDSSQWFDWMRNYASLNGTDEAERVMDQYPGRIVPQMDGSIKIELTEVEE